MEEKEGAFWPVIKPALLLTGVSAAIVGAAYLLPIVVEWVVKAALFALVAFLGAILAPLAVTAMAVFIAIYNRLMR